MRAEVRNSSVENFLSLVTSGDLPAPAPDLLSMPLSAAVRGDKAKAPAPGAAAAPAPAPVPVAPGRAAAAPVARGAVAPAAPRGARRRRRRCRPRPPRRAAAPAAPAPAVAPAAAPVAAPPAAPPARSRGSGRCCSGGAGRRSDGMAVKGRRRPPAFCESVAAPAPPARRATARIRRPLIARPVPCRPAGGAGS